MKMKVQRVNIGLVLAVILGLLVTLSAPPGERPVSANAGNGVLAYVLPNDDTGDEIHFINADGTGDRQIWSTGQPGVPLIREIHSLAWKPDASELAFMSRFQDGCSIYKEDVYAVRPDGTGLRRQTAPYGCGPNPGLPTGTVVLTVLNYNGDGVFIVYVQGAPAPQSVEPHLAAAPEQATAVGQGPPDRPPRLQAQAGGVHRARGVRPGPAPAPRLLGPDRAHLENDDEQRRRGAPHTGHRHRSLPPAAAVRLPSSASRPAPAWARLG